MVSKAARVHSKNKTLNECLLLPSNGFSWKKNAE